MENYIIYQDGQIYSIKRNKFLKPNLTKEGYFQVNLSGKVYYVHRLVALKHLPNPNNYKIINHINGIKNDNRLENLEWCTQRHNINHYHNSNYTSVYKLPSGKYASKYYKDKKQIHIGTFDTKEEAYEAYLKTIKKFE